MKTRNIYLIFLFLCAGFNLWSQGGPRPKARFTFNYGASVDEISGISPKLVGANYTLDRFGNDNCAIFLSGDESSYINLGKSKELKPVNGSISLWISIENKVWSGTGAELNPILLTKYTNADDFFESYAIYYFLRSGKLYAVSAIDSTRQINLPYVSPVKKTEWYHLAITYDHDYFCFYVNGRLVGKLPKNYDTKFIASDSVLIGSSANKFNKRSLQGIVDDIEFYDKVLTEGEINALYNAPDPNRKRTILYRSLFVSALLLVVALIYLWIRYYIRKTLRKERLELEITNKLLENELRINRALMNPHFIFNSLNTLHNYILGNNSSKASDYLLKFSKLIRKILDSNMSDTISLELELELIDRYLEIEGMRFKEHFKHLVITDLAIVPSSIVIPVMMIQPFIENSVWHGLRDKKGDKIITIRFSLHETRYLRCIIDDNGTGRKNKNPNVLEKKSLATGFVKQRLELLNKINGLDCTLAIIDKPGGEGTIVDLLLPILNK